jgi:hypothetical protein
MIEVGKEIPLVSIGSKNRWHLKIVGDAFQCFQYFPRYASSILSGNGPFAMAAQSHSGLKPYFRRNKKNSDKNPCAERIVSFGVDNFDQELKIFIFPISVCTKMIDIAAIDECRVKGTDWEIIKTGTGMGTRYTTNKIEDDCPLSEDDWEIINYTMNKVSIDSVIFKSEDVYIERKYTDFDRFDIMDIMDIPDE